MWRSGGRRWGAHERTRTSTSVSSLHPECSASTSSATWASRFESYSLTGSIRNTQTASEHRRRLVHAFFAPVRTFVVLAGANDETGGPQYPLSDGFGE